MTDKGSIDVLSVAEIIEPELTTAFEVKIKIMAAGVNPIDTKVRRNGSFFEQPLPLILGCDGAGKIVLVGNEVTDFKVGDEVWFCNGGLGKEQGNYAEYTVINSRWVVIKPKNISFIEAAAMPLSLITAYSALFDKGNLQKGQTVLIHAGAGGVGHLAIQLAKLKGAEVITTVSTKEKAEFVKSLGADYAIDYSQNGFTEEVNQLTKGNGVNLVIDTVGPEVFKESMAVTSFFGRLITLLDPGPVPLAEARMRNLLLGFELMLTPMIKQLDSTREKQIAILKQCAEWVEQGLLRVHVSNVLPLEHVATAHNEIELGHMTGKMVLQIHHSSRLQGE